MTAQLNPKLVGAVEKAVVAETGSPQKAEEVAKTLETVVKSDPVLANATGQEPWWQSGVGLFGSGGVLWSIGVLFTQIGAHGSDLQSYDANTTLTAAGALAMFAGVLYRRYVPGLKPIFWKLTQRKQ